MDRVVGTRTRADINAAMIVTGFMAAPFASSPRCGLQIESLARRTPWDSATRVPPGASRSEGARPLLFATFHCLRLHRRPTRRGKNFPSRTSKPFAAGCSIRTGRGEANEAMVSRTSYSKRSCGLLQPVEREDVLSDRGDLATSVLFRPAARVFRQFHGRIREGLHLEAEPCHIRSTLGGQRLGQRD